MRYQHYTILHSILKCNQVIETSKTHEQHCGYYVINRAHAHASGMIIGSAPIETHLVPKH